MKKAIRKLAVILVMGLIFSNTFGAMIVGAQPMAIPEDELVSVLAPLVPQELNFAENPVDIPNPDRGFYRPQEYVIPVSGGTPGFPNLSATITGTSVQVSARIVYMEFDLRNFSSNAPLNRRPIGPWSAVGAQKPDYGTTQPLTSSALNYVRAALQRVKDSEAVAIVKFNYDGSGYTYIDSGIYDQVIHDCEPGAPQGRVWYETGVLEESDLCGIDGHEEKNWVQYHLWQLGNVFSEFEECIMAVKGGIFGPWGEMHSSSYARTPEGYAWLLNALLDYVPNSRSILVHAGGVMAWHNETYGTDYSFTNPIPAPARGTPAQRFGMFNDSYSRGLDGDYYNDNGSLSEGYALIGEGDEDDFDRDVVLTWMRNQNNFYGGETVGAGGATNIYPRFPAVPYEAAYAQTTHLNTSYNQGTYSLWGNFVYNEANVTAPVTFPHNGKTVTAIFDPVYDGRNGMEFMRDRLGYRLVMREANASEWVEETGTLEFEGKIQNVGFGNVVNKKNVAVILKAKDSADTFSVLTNLDARDWQPALDGRATNTAAWRDLSFSVDMSAFGEVPLGEYDIYLKINDPKETNANKRCIQFANHDIWNASLSANLIGSTTVVEDATRLSLTTDAHLLMDGEYFKVYPFFNREVASNTAMMELEFDKDLFDYRGFTPADGVQVLRNEEVDNGRMVTFMVDNYATLEYGEFLLSAKEEANLQNEDHELSVELRYVVIDEAGGKEILTATASTLFPSTNGNDPTVPEPGAFTLITLSNVIDKFGLSKGAAEWAVYRFFDKNNNGVIDIADICWVASQL